MVGLEELGRDADGDLLRRLAADVEPDGALHARELRVGHAARWDEATTYVAIMTHRHDLDQEIVARVVDRPARYIGLIGSQTKWNRFRDRLLARGMPEAKLSRVKCPIGIDVGGKAPQEVAISIAAELLKTHHGR